MASHAVKHRISKELICPSVVRLVVAHQNAHCLQHVVTTTTSGMPTHGLTCAPKTQGLIGPHMP